MVEKARHGVDQTIVITLAGRTAGELDGSRLRSFGPTKKVDRVRVSIERGRPYGEETWVRETVKDLGLEQTVRPKGRPESETIGDRGDKLNTQIPSGGQFDRQTNCIRV
jgi:hypothetical protein